MALSEKELAQYLRDSVSFDFSQRTVSSYEQIRRLNEEFYALEDPFAFTSLLTDVIGYDSQLIDIFNDLRTADRGFRYFANIGNREKPNAAVTFFLSDSRFEARKQELAKVYYAINTWLCFFGSEELKTEWTYCPICAAHVMSGVCSSCKTEQERFLPIMVELQTLLETEKSGTEAVLPPYYANISGKAQFSSYRARIDAIRKRREQKKRLDEERKKQAVIAPAIQELKNLEQKVLTEATRTEPTFDGILTALDSDPTIVNALIYDDKAVTDRIRSIRDHIARTKESLRQKTEQDELISTVKAHLSEFLVCKNGLENELNIPPSQMDPRRLRKVAEAAKNAFAKVIAVSPLLPQFFSYEEKQMMLDYQQKLEPNAERLIKSLTEAERLEEEKGRLLTALQSFKMKCDECRKNGAGAEKLLSAFNRDIENDRGFMECRKDPDWSNMYLSSTLSLRKLLDRLVREQTEKQSASAQARLSALSQRAKLAKPGDNLSQTLRSELASIKNDRRYNGVKGSQAYKAGISRLENDISTLEAKEAQYRQARQVKKIALIAAIAAAALVLVLIFALLIPKACRSDKEKNEESVSARSDTVSIVSTDNFYCVTNR